MEPLKDDELNTLLREWKAPPPPTTLTAPAMPREPWWRWLLTGSIRVPVPVSVAVALALSILAIQALRPKPQALSDEFQPVAEVTPRLIRSTSHENQR